jgi:hypothetical protein
MITCNCLPKREKFVQETRSVPNSSGNPVRHPSGTPKTVRNPKLRHHLHDTLRSHHYSRRTEQRHRNQFKELVSLHNIRPRFEICSQRICCKRLRHSHSPGTFGTQGCENDHCQRAIIMGRWKAVGISDPINVKRSGKRCRVSRRTTE